MKRLQLLREVTKDGRYTRHYGIKRIDWNVDVPVPYRALCISFGTRDIIVCYAKRYRLRRGGTIEKRSHRAQMKMTESKVYSDGKVCCKHGGYCPQDNFCPWLENPRGGDFGWGECIYRLR